MPALAVKAQAGFRNDVFTFHMLTTLCTLAGLCYAELNGEHLPRPDGELVIFNGVTRATRIAKLAPGKLVRVEVIGHIRRAGAIFPRIGDLIP